MRAALVMCSGVDAALKQAIRERRRIGETSPDGVGEGGGPDEPCPQGVICRRLHTANASAI